MWRLKRGINATVFTQDSPQQACVPETVKNVRNSGPFNPFPPARPDLRDPTKSHFSKCQDFRGHCVHEKSKVRQDDDGDGAEGGEVGGGDEFGP